MSAQQLVALAAVAAAASPDLAKGGLSALKDRLRAGLAKDPMDTVVATVAVSSWLFYEAEKDVNPKVRSFEDALVYCSTCLSVGYADIFARTPTGKTIATLLMTFGPALAARALDFPAGHQEHDRDREVIAGQRVVAEKLDAILAELKARPR